MTHKLPPNNTPCWETSMQSQGTWNIFGNKPHWESLRLEFEGILLTRGTEYKGYMSTGVGCRFLLQGIFPTQGANPGLLHCRQTLYHLSHQGLFIRNGKNFKDQKYQMLMKMYKARLILLGRTCLLAIPLPVSLQEKNSLCLEIDLHTKDHSSLIYQGWKLETTQGPATRERVNTLWYIHTMEQNSATKRNKLWHKHTGSDRRTSQNHAEWKKPNIKHYIFFFLDSTHIC